MVITETGIQGDMYNDAHVCTEVFDSRPVANKAAQDLFREKIADLGSSLVYTVFDSCPDIQCRIFGETSVIVIAVTEI